MEPEDGVVGESPAIRISTSEVDDLEAVGAVAREGAVGVHVAAVGPDPDQEPVGSTIEMPSDD